MLPFFTLLNSVLDDEEGQLIEDSNRAGKFIGVLLFQGGRRGYLEE